MQKGIGTIHILVILALLVLAGSVGYIYLQPAIETTTPQSSSVPASPDETANRKTYKNEIQDLLNKQCQALSSKSLGLLISTIDQSNINVFQEYKQSVEILLSMTDSVIKCQYEIQGIQLNENVKDLIAETAEKGALEIRLIDGSTKMIEDSNISHVGKYIKIGEEWKQIIQ